MAKAPAREKGLYAKLRRLVQAQFPNANIEAVRFEMDEDSDGDPILRIVVVFEDAAAFNAVNAAGLVRHIRPKMSDDTFPLVSFITSADNRKVQAATG